MRGSRREQIAPVECPRDALERVVGVRQLVGLGDAAELVDGRKQQAVVRADVDPSFAVAQSESAPRRPDSRIDDGEVDSDRHVRKRVREGQRALKHLSRRYPVGDVNDLGVRRDALHHAVTGSDEVVLEPEVGQERDEAAHGAAA